MTAGPPARPLRVAYVLATSAGGTAAHVAALAAGCRDAGLAVRAFGPEGTAGLFGPGIGFEPVEITGLLRPGSDAAAIVRLRRTLTTWRPDVVHAHGLRAGGFASLALLACPRPGLVVTVHNAPPGDRFGALVYRVLAGICVRRAAVVLCASADLAARMRRLAGNRVSLFAVPAGEAAPPSGEAIAKARADIGAAGRPVVLGVGRLAAQKGFDVLVAAAERWRDRDPEPLTVIAGDGPLAAELRRRSGPGVLLLGQRDDVPALMEVADVVAVPSRWEARALVVQEAMRAGRPIVATRVGGTAELTGEDAAVLIPPDDPAALAAAVTTLLDDPLRATVVGRAAAARSTSFPTRQDALNAALALYARLAAAS